MTRISRILIFALLFTTAGYAKNRAVAPPVAADALGIGLISGSAVSGTVATVSGAMITLNTGAAPAIRIDAANAKFASRDGSGSIADVKAGSRITAFLGTGTVAAGAPLVAQLITIEPPPPDLVLAGAIESIDVAGSKLVVLGSTISVDANTRFATAFPTFVPIRGLSDLQVGQTVVVDTSVGVSILARHVLVVSPTRDQVVTLRGKVKSITDKSWVITESSGTDRTILLDERTKISGNPAVGDEVQVLARVDAASNTLALAILKLGTRGEVELRGYVKSIGTDVWSIGGPPGSLSPEYLVKITPTTSIYANPALEDHVVVTGARDGGNLVARSIRKEDTPPSLFVELHGIIEKMTDDRWTLGPMASPLPVEIRITRATMIYRNPAVGDRVVVTGIRESATTILALKIGKE